jgi:hypothetical protein
MLFDKANKTLERLEAEEIVATLTAKGVNHKVVNEVIMDYFFQKSVMWKKLNRTLKDTLCLRK